MKIAFIIPGLTSKGPVFLLRNLVKGLMNKNIEPIVFYFDDRCELYFPCKTMRISFNKEIDFDSFDIIHSHGLRADLYVYRWKYKIKKAKIVSTIHQDTYVNFKYKFPKPVAFVITRFWCYMQNHFNAVVAISNQIKEIYSKYFSTYITTIYNGVDIDVINGFQVNTNIIKCINEQKKNGFKLLGLYALIGERKGIDQIIKALPVMKDFSLIIIGDGPYKNTLYKLAVTLKVDNRIIFIPAQQYPFLYLDDIDIYCMPSYSEAFGLAVVEAALKGKAIVCSDIPSFHEIFMPQEACFFKLNNQESLINAIESAYSNKTIYGDIAKKRAENNFTYQIMSENYLKLYNRLLTHN